MSNEPTPLDDFEPIDDLELPVSLPPNRSTPVVIVDEAKYLAMQQRIRELEAGYEARGKTIDAMTEDIEAMHAEIEHLRAELARLREQVQWEPLPDGNYDGLEVSANGSEIGLSTHDVHGIQWPVDHWLSDDIRLCRRNPNAQPQPASVPVEAIRTIVYALQAWWSYTSDAGLPSKTEVRDLEIVRRWLDAQPDA